MNTILARIGSMLPFCGEQKTQLKTTPKRNLSTVRRIEGVTRWFILESNLRIGIQFGQGLMRDVTFNPRGAVMERIVCGEMRISEADAIGELEIGQTQMPGDVSDVCFIGYDTRGKNFHDRNNPQKIITSADYLLLQENGKAVAGWKKQS